MRARLLEFICLLVLCPCLTLADVVENATATPIAWNNDAPFITCGARDSISGDYWIGTEEHGLWRYDGTAWKQYSKGDGLADDNIYAVAIDAQGRVWAGTLNHGVSVFNGQAWRNYDVDTGPLGPRVFAIKICPAGPMAGEVWIGTDAGISRYSPKDNRWSYITRAEGLPSDQVQCIAFDRGGRVVVGTQCEGIALASPEDDYAKWTHVEGPARPTTDPAGAGLPSCMINDVLITKDDRMYVATPWGLGKSVDGGKHFTYRRGVDGDDRVHNRTGGEPPKYNPADVVVLGEDYVTCLAEDEAGLLWIGYRTHGYEAVDEPREALKLAGGEAVAANGFGTYVTTILPPPDAGALIGGYSTGVQQAEKFFTVKPANGGAAPAAPATRLSAPLRYPSPAAAPSPRAVDAMRLRLSNAQPTPLTAAFLGDDWSTQGDGIGRYGRQQYALPVYGSAGWAQGYAFNIKIGPHTAPNGDGPYTYYHTLDSDERRVLWVPNSGKREAGEWNDGTFDKIAYPQFQTWEGPDLWMDITVPAGAHRVSLYFSNFDGHRYKDKLRDFLVELKPHADTIEAADFSPDLARTRVVNFYNGVYKQFIVSGPNQYYIKINRNYSFVAKATAVFFDRIAGDAPANEPRGVPIMGDQQIVPPAIAEGAVETNAQMRAVADLWSMLDNGWSTQEMAVLQRPYRLMALRFAAESGGADDLRANWRFAVPTMTAADHAQFETTAAAAASKLPKKDN